MHLLGGGEGEQDAETVFLAGAASYHQKRTWSGGRYFANIILDSARPRLFLFRKMTKTQSLINIVSEWQTEYYQLK